MADEPSRGSGQFILNPLFAIRYSRIRPPPIAARWTGHPHPRTRAIERGLVGWDMLPVEVLAILNDQFPSLAPIEFGRTELRSGSRLHIA